MTVKEVQDAVKAIEAMDCNEGMHAEEDKLLRNVMRCIANGTNKDSPQQLAKACVKVIDLPFIRWYA